MINLKYDREGLIPAVLQDVTTGKVLMVAWMNAEALERTQETGQAHFWSRSRAELWHKGATSGNVMSVQEILVDCDADTLLLKVQPAGPACHTGESSCFFRALDQFQELRLPNREIDPAGINEHEVSSQMLAKLFSVIEDRKLHPTERSYTHRLMSAGENRILRKIGEEAVELILAAKGEGNGRLVEEVSDLFYHILVLLSFRGLTLAQVEEELAHRHDKGQEK